MFYLYVYLDPRKPGNFIYDDLKFNYEPIYIGKGKKNRLYDHLKDALNNKNNFKSKKIRKIIIFLKNDPDKFKNYIHFLIKSEDENFILKKEKEYIEKIGTIKKVENVAKRGPLTNLCEGGGSNPVLKGSRNPMFRKTIFDVWREKGMNVEAEREKWKNSLKISHSNEYYYPWWKSQNKEQISEKISEKARGKNNMRYKLSKEKLGEIEFRRLGSFKNTIQNRSSEKSKKISDGQSLKMKKFWKEISYERMDEFKKSVKESLRNYYSDLSTNLEKQKIIKIRTKKGIESRQGTPEKQERFCKIMKENNYLNKSNLSREEYFKEKYGEDYLRELNKKLSEKASGKNNPMFGKGYKIEGPKNGRSKNIIIHFPSGEKYLCIGTFKKFCKEVLSRIKPMPHRKYKFEIEKDGWFFSVVDDLTKIRKEDYIFYE